MLFDFLEPFSNVTKGFFTGDIISQKYTMSSAIENSSYRTERFLSCGVPNLKLYNFIFNLGYKGSEFNSYSHLMLNFELIIHDSCKKARFSYA